jgi:beta-N-acetylhexosaminidase
LLCSARDLSQGEETVDAMTDALQSRQLNPGQFRNSLRRTMALRNSLA